MHQHICEVTAVRHAGQWDNMLDPLSLNINILTLIHVFGEPGKDSGSIGSTLKIIQKDETSLQYEVEAG